jgi:hypothetical protein
MKDEIWIREQLKIVKGKLEEHKQDFKKEIKPEHQMLMSFWYGILEGRRSAFELALGESPRWELPE